MSTTNKTGGDPAPSSAVRFGFVVHPLNRWQQRLLGAWTLYRSPAVVRRYPRLITGSGTVLQGQVVGIPYTPEQMLADQERAVAEIGEAVLRLARWGARCVGLGAVAALVGARGQAVASRVAVPVTTGHGLTTFASLRTLDLAARFAGIPRDEPVAVLGAPGPVALGLAACLGAAGREVKVALDPLPPPVARYLGRWPSVRPMPRRAALAGSRLVLGASSTGGSLTEQELAPGAVLVDVAQPRDLLLPPSRRDVLVVDGELVCLPPGCVLDHLTRIYNRVVGQGSRHVLACFAEPMVLATAGAERAAALCRPGRYPDPAAIVELGALAEAEGFAVDGLFQRGRPLAGHE